MESDIVARLRSNARFFGLVKLGSRATIDPEFCEETATWFAEAADEIERLREALRIEREESAGCAIDRKETQRERDEARREVCEWMSLQTERQPRVIAQNRGWDCFKKEEATDD